MSPFSAFRKSALLCAGALAVSGFVGGNPLVHSQSVRIRTDPPGAVATSEHGDSCITPCRLRLRTSRGGIIRVAHASYEPVDVVVGTRHSPYRVAATAAQAANLMADPDPVSLGFFALHFLIDGAGHTRRLSTRRVDIAMTPLGLLQAREILQASALPPLRDGIRRLSPEEVEEILGPPLPVRRAPVFAAGVAAPAAGGGD
jgi:hypothetical protein